MLVSEEAAECKAPERPGGSDDVATVKVVLDVWRGALELRGELAAILGPLAG
jgi:hypothetical protein